MLKLMAAFLALLMIVALVTGCPEDDVDVPVKDAAAPSDAAKKEAAPSDAAKKEAATKKEASVKEAAPKDSSSVKEASPQG
jgi:hypothetical protein|tara:strand:+ start:619 stop:861 length:243 start_codon:yes stop_codon:yes gene_type:complete